MTDPTPLANARATIAIALSVLERETGQQVVSVGITDVDVTQMTDSTPQYEREVHITLRTIPGHHWVMDY
jgi:hypothetical protein